MSKIKHALVVLILGVAGGSAAAVTFAELAEKNARLLSAKADTAVAKAQNELLLEQARAKSGTAFGAGGAPVPAIQQGADGPKAEAAAKKPAAPEIFLNAIHGPVGNLSADFQRADVPISREAGELLFDGWQLVSVTYPKVKVIKQATAKKEKEVCKIVSIGASFVNSPAC